MHSLRNGKEPCAPSCPQSPRAACTAMQDLGQQRCAGAALGCRLLGRTAAWCCSAHAERTALWGQDLNPALLAAALLLLLVFLVLPSPLGFALLFWHLVFQSVV